MNGNNQMNELNRQTAHPRRNSISLQSPENVNMIIHDNIELISFEPELAMKSQQFSLIK